MASGDYGSGRYGAGVYGVGSLGARDVVLKSIEPTLREVGIELLARGVAVAARPRIITIEEAP